MNTKTKMRMAFPKKGRLKDSFNALMQKAGLDTYNKPRQDFGQTRDRQGIIEEFETLFQRPGDALENLDLGLIDCALVGKDNFIETAARLGEEQKRSFNGRIAMTFDFAVCSLMIAAPAGQAMQSPADLEGKRIATSYPASLRLWLAQNNVENVTIIAREGGIEDYVRLGMADAVCDIVESGNTLAANGLVPTISLFDSSAVLVLRSDSQNPALERLVQRLSDVTAEKTESRSGNARRVPSVAQAVPA